MKNIQVLVLAGGEAKRMRPITANKNLLPFFGRPLIVHAIENLKKSGFKDFIVVVNPQIKEEVKKYLGNVKVVVQKRPLGQADAILSAEKEIKDRPLLIVNANDFFQPSLFVEFNRKIKNNPDALLVGLKTDCYLSMGYLVVKNGLVERVVEKPGKGREPSDMIKLVVDFYQKPKTLLQFLKKTKSNRDDVYEVAMAKMMKKGIKFELVKYNDSWATIKYPWDILETAAFFLNEKKKKSVIAEEGVKIFEGAVVKNSYLGKNVIVGNNALVRDSIIEDGCVIGYNTEIARSYIGPNCWFHANYIGDSILEENISFGSGARIANLRLDEKEIVPGRVKMGAIIGSGVRVGINTSIMPGVQIGSNSFVGSGLVLEENLKENKFCYLEQKVVVRENLRKIDLETRDKFKKKL